MIYSRALEAEPGQDFALPINYLTTFTSRKNLVFLIKYGTELAVCKFFYSIQAAHKEWYLLFRLRSLGIPAPRPITLFGQWSIREFVDGLSIMDMLDSGRSDLKWTLPLARWLYDFHRYANLKLGDVNLRNFIFKEDIGSIFAIDFEDVTTGNPLEDLGDLAVHILTHRPSFTELKFRAAASVLKSYIYLAEVDKDMIVDEVYNGFLRAAIRRKNPQLLDSFQFVKKIDSLLESSI